MSREIKFRAWDDKQYHYDNFMMRNGMAYCFGEFSREDLYLMDWELEQYTGLKDKNGVEIYEGDIILSPTWGWNNRTKIKHHIVSWGKYEWCANGYNGVMPVSPRIDVRNDWEIIGNIHEGVKDDK